MTIVYIKGLGQRQVDAAIVFGVPLGERGSQLPPFRKSAIVKVALLVANARLRLGCFRAT